MYLKITIFCYLFLLNKVGYGQNTYEQITNDSVGLKTVVIKSYKKRPLEILNSRYTTGLFSNMASSRVLDLSNNQITIGISILEYLQGKIMGLTIQKNIEGFEVTTSRSLSIQNNKSKINTSFASTSVKLYLDEIEVNSSVFNFIHPSDVAFVKYFPPGSSQISFNEGQGILAVYLKK